jgi:hypothetical protein
MKKYFCWGEDKEDLTEQVNISVFHLSKTAAIASNPVAKKRSTKTALIKGSSAAKKRLKKWRVCVTCSQGHENIFEGEALSLPKPDVVLKR